MSKIALPLAAALASLCACGPTRVYSNKDATVSVTEKGKDEGSIHMTTKEGVTADFNSGKPITDYPADAPLYSGKAAMDIKRAEKHSRVISIQTPDSMDKIVEFYKAGLDSKGWKVEATMTRPGMSLFVATKDNRKLTISIGVDEGAKLQNIGQVLEDVPK